MASNFSALEDDLSCPVCCDIFTCPVLLPCSHSICKTCLQDCWKSRSRKCPVCRRESPEADPPVNLSLKNLCETVLQERAAAGSTQAICSLHHEKLSLFCLVDQEPLCVDCLPAQHRDHKFCHLKVAVRDHKMKLKPILKTLQDKLKAFCKVRDTGDLISKHIKDQAQNTEIRIKEGFKELHQFLQDEEAARIAAVRKETNMKTVIMNRKMAEISRKIASLSTTISSIEEDMIAEDLSFLQNYNATVRRAQCNLQDPKIHSGSLINVAQHLGSLKYRVLEKMLRTVQYSPVTLDPNTANRCFILDKDLTTLTSSKANQQLPENPERFKDIERIMGLEGFTSGKHSWDVEFGDVYYMHIGVAKESVKGKKYLRYPENGIWCIWMYLNAWGTWDTTVANLNVRESMRKVRVLLDYDRGEVSFSDLRSVNKPFYTFKATFTDRLFPFFEMINCSGVCEYLKILPANVSLKV